MIAEVLGKCFNHNEGAYIGDYTVDKIYYIQL